MGLTMLLVRALLVAALLLAAGSADAGLPTVLHEGRTYVELDRLAERLRARLEPGADGTHTSLKINGRQVVFVRNRAEALVDGKPVALDAPVRVQQGVWLVPESVNDRVLPRLQAGAAGVTLQELRFRSYPSYTRVVLETSGPVTYRVEPAAGREVRVRVASLVASARTEEVRDGFVGELRLERAGNGAVLRVVFEGAAAEPRVTTLVDPHRLVLDFQRPEEPEPRGRREAPSPLRVIVLDAGHGGHDSGAVGPTGLMEKDLVLDVTRRVARLVESELGVRALLSRDGDYFVPLRDRTSFANRERADLFVSIHANAHRQASWAGVETYFLSSEATDSEARQLAALENSVVKLEKPVGRGRSADVVKAILWDLAQSAFQMESSNLAEIVQDSMTRALKLPNRGVKQAGFYVLGGAAMPAILIEIGFVTNPAEERRMRDSRYRDEIARAIFAGIAEYKRHWDQRMRATADRGR
jgi:N-acetylmuramoyl-L-alanine amidase